MNQAHLSGTLGNVQLIAYVNANHGDAVREAAKELGFNKVTIEVGTVVQATEFFRTNASPEILLIEVANAEEAPAQLDALADVINPHTKVIVCGPIDSYRFYHWLMDLGIHEYLLQPFTAAQLRLAIVKGASKKTESAIAQEQQTKKLIAVIGARGGVGTTTVATNLGALYARTKLSTAIIDLDAYFGSVALNFDLEPSRGLRDAFEKPDRVDGLFLERVMVKPVTGLSILSAEEPLSDVINAQTNAGEMLFAALHEKFNMVIVDLPRQMNPITRYVMANADAVVLVAEPQLISLRDSLRIKDYLVDQLKRPAPHVLLNRVGMLSKHELPTKDFTKHYGAAPAGKIPYLAEAVAATAQGELLVDQGKLSAQLSDLHRLAQALSGKDNKGAKETDAEDDEEEEKSTGFARFLKGKK